jgi:hypothetical protein
MCESSTSGNFFATSITISRQKRLVSSTFSLSTEQSFRLRFIAAWKPTSAMRRISGSEYSIMS